MRQDSRFFSQTMTWPSRRLQIKWELNPQERWKQLKSLKVQLKLRWLFSLPLWSWRSGLDFCLSEFPGIPVALLVGISNFLVVGISNFLVVLLVGISNFLKRSWRIALKLGCQQTLPGQHRNLPTPTLNLHWKFIIYIISIVYDIITDNKGIPGVAVCLGLCL